MEGGVKNEGIEVNDWIEFSFTQLGIFCWYKGSKLLKQTRKPNIKDIKFTINCMSIKLHVHATKIPSK